MTNPCKMSWFFISIAPLKGGTQNRSSQSFAFAAIISAEEFVMSSIFQVKRTMSRFLRRAVMASNARRRMLAAVAVATRPRSSPWSSQPAGGAPPPPAPSGLRSRVWWRWSRPVAPPSPAARPLWGNCPSQGSGPLWEGWSWEEAPPQMRPPTSTSLITRMTTSCQWAPALRCSTAACPGPAAPPRQPPATGTARPPAASRPPPSLSPHRGRVHWAFWGRPEGQQPIKQTGRRACPRWTT